ncbi:MAG: hypothetical protein ABFS09_04850 [Thermodesulfobacteriota bacterium]
MQPPQQQVIAITRSKVKSRRQRVTLEPLPKTSLASEITKACLSTMFIVGLLFSTVALFTLAAVSIRCLVTLW